MVASAGVMCIHHPKATIHIPEVTATHTFLLHKIIN